MVCGDLPQRRCTHMISEAPREHRDPVGLGEVRRVESRLVRSLARRCTAFCLCTLLAIRDEQYDLGRARAAIVGEEVARRVEAGRDRGVALRRYLVDPRVDLGLVVRPWHARPRNRTEGHHREARRVLSEEVMVYLGRHRRVGFELRLGIARGLNLSVAMGAWPCSQFNAAWWTSSLAKAFSASM